MAARPRSNYDGRVDFRGADAPSIGDYKWRHRYQKYRITHMTFRNKTHWEKSRFGQLIKKSFILYVDLSAIWAHRDRSKDIDPKIIKRIFFWLSRCYFLSKQLNKDWIVLQVTKLWNVRSCTIFLFSFFQVLDGVAILLENWLFRVWARRKF